MRNPFTTAQPDKVVPVPASQPASPAGAVRAPRAGGYRLLPTPRPAPVELDDAQRAVTTHSGGPLLVLAGPGTGKTTTLVEAVRARVAAGLRPEQVLVLTFSRAAAGELRDRIGARLDATGGTPTATTFHAFCYALLRTYQDPELFAAPPRLLTGPEQDVAVRELVAGTLALGSVAWPAPLRAALGTRGFAEELRDVLSRAREQALDPIDLVRAARSAGRADWAAAASFFGEYLDVLDARGILDYAELVHRAALLAAEPEVRTALRERFRAVFVDEYQDTDDGQTRLLRELAGDGRDLVVFGDPDQSIYAFRGARVRGILDFPREFRHADGRPADVAVLRTSNRAGATLLAASRRLAGRMPLRRLPADVVRAHRELTARRNPYGPGDVSVLTFPTAARQADAIADLLRRAHLEDGVPWREMAVLVRSATRSVAPLRRALLAAGVPVWVSGDELPIGAEPAVAAMLAALRCASDPRALTAEAAAGLLTGPLGGLDAARLRRLARALRAEEAQAIAASGGSGVPRPATELVREALAEPERLVALEADVADPAWRLGTLLRAARDKLATGGTVEDALWILWHGCQDAGGRHVSTGWRDRLERLAGRPGPAGRSADRDLDALCVLFDDAARAVDGGGGQSVLDFVAELEAERIAADVRAGQAAHADAVTVTSAHRSKGLQWRLVVLADVQEGLWPDLRLRGSLLRADQIGAYATGAPPLEPAAERAAMLAEERRLFYVAVTRARQRLVVAAVDSASSGADDGETPSRFIRELGVPVRAVAGTRHRALTTSALVAELRAALVDPKTSDAVRAVAADRLARLADLRDEDGVPLVRAAHPASWWGVAPLTAADRPVRDPAHPVRLSASQVSAVTECALRWFLGHEARAEEPSSAPQTFGNLVHALADDVARGEAPADLDALLERLDRVWDRVAYEAPWQSAQERQEARAALERFLAWHVAERGRTVAASEHGFDVVLTAGGYRIRITGSIDRVETGETGQVYLVDFKTGRTAESAAAAERHPQLAVYQLAVGAGALAGTEAAGAPVGGAELVYLRKGVARSELPVIREQPPLDTAAAGEAARDADWPGRMLAEVAARVLDERFGAYGEPSVCDRCQFRRSCPKHPEGRHLVQ